MLRDLYRESVPKLMQSIGIDNVMRVPRVKSVHLNIGYGAACKDSKLIAAPVDDLSLIAMQRAVQTVAKKSVAGFGLRKGFPIGAKVTLRRDKAYDFMERLIYVALPREKDFRGFSGSQFDGKGNFSFSVREHISFLEVDYDKVHSVYGVNVTIVTTAHTDADALKLFMVLGFPFYDVQ